MKGATYDVVVAGGGIVGAACASEFTNAGLRVALIEPHVVGGGATAAGMGHIAVMDDSEGQFNLTRYSQKLWKELVLRLPPQAEYLPCGALWVAADEEEMAEVHRKHRYYQDRQTPAEILDGRALAEAEPALRPGLAGALLLPDDGVVYSPVVAKFLVDEAREHGLKLILGRNVAAVAETGVTLDDETFVSCGISVVATGCAAGVLARGVQVRPRKGHLAITDRYPGLVRHQLIELGYLKSAHNLEADSVACNVQPRLTGQILIGSSRQFGAEDGSIDSAMLSSMLRRVVEYLPALADVQIIRTWTGFRASTPDKLPLIGACPGYRNVYLATGHEGLGIVTSLGTAKLIAGIVLSRPTAIPAEPYSPQRDFAYHG